MCREVSSSLKTSKLQMKLSMIGNLKSIFILKKVQVADTLTPRKVSATGLKCQMQIYI